MKNNLENISQELSQELLKQISFLAFEQSYNSVVVTNADVENPLFVYVNPAFTKQTGYSFDEVIGKTPKILQGEKTDRAVIDKLKKSLQERTFFQGSTSNYKKDGSEYSVEWNISPIFNEEGVVTHFVSFQMDITNTIKLAQKNQELLIQQSKLASVGELMNAIAHQWKQPLGIISAFAQILLHQIKKEINKAQVQVKLEKILEQTNFMSDTISSFQNFLRPVDLQASFNVKKAIEETLALMKDQLSSSQVSVHFSSAQEDLEVTGSENEFKQVVLNLLVNAKDAFVSQGMTSARNIEINVVLEDSFVGIDVIDNAGGIKISPIEKIFENNISTKGDKGTGIGLYIVKQIISRLQGEINVSLVGDSGTKFYIRLPLAR